MDAGYCTLGELHTALSLCDVADAHDYLIATQEARAEAQRRASKER